MGASSKVHDAAREDPWSHTIEFHAGRNRKTFFVPKKVLPRSAYFQDLMAKKKGNHPRRIHNDLSVEPEIFQLYSQLVEYDDLPAMGETKADANENYHKLTKLAVLCEKLGDMTAKNDITEAILRQARVRLINGSRSAPSHEHVQTIYNGMGKGSGARRLMVDIALCRSTFRDQIAKNRRGLYPKEFFRECVLAMQMAGKDITLTCAASRYHDGVPREEDSRLQCENDGDMGQSMKGDDEGCLLVGEWDCDGS